MTDSENAHLPDDSEVQKVLQADLSKSEKIRRLAGLGLARTAIRDLLGIRYQHVRKVLLDAGISSPETRPRPARPYALPGEVAAKTTRAAELGDYGFLPTASWLLIEDAITLDGTAPGEPGLYAFTVNEIVVYIGLTQIALRTRMGHYRRGHARQRTSARVNELIRQALAEGHIVGVYTCIPGNVEWKGLDVALAPSLEATLISRLRPLWNIQGKRQK